MLRPSLFLALVALTSAAASAQPTGLRGTFVLNRSASADVNAAVERAVAPLNVVVRQIARPRLRRTNQPYGRIVLDWSPTEVSITTDARAAIRTSPVGTAIRWRRPEDGEWLNVSTVWQGDRLQQTFAAEDGQRVNLYTLGPDGRTLTLDVTVTSPRLARPLTYRLVYAKQ
ncbi:MAG TPA: hypothetical protein VD948_04005 [Rhodothermales bacterium]|nr:hypothetical protein [Rhodothermales bacterium]